MDHLPVVEYRPDDQVVAVIYPLVTAYQCAGCGAVSAVKPDRCAGCGASALDEVPAIVHGGRYFALGDIADGTVEDEL